MKILVVTNLYPPQNLGGYGRCLQDFTLSLCERGHTLLVVCADAPYLLDSSADSSNSLNTADSPAVVRTLQLKGSYENGISFISDPAVCRSIDQQNVHALSELLGTSWDVALVGNLDLLGPYLLNYLTYSGLHVFHHHGFINPPFPYSSIQHPELYTVLPASHSVRQSLLASNFAVSESNVIYPGASTKTFSSRCKSFSSSLQYSSKLASFDLPLGSVSNPIKIGYAGLIMSSKGLHTIVESVIDLASKGYYVQLYVAGETFQSDYYTALLSLLGNCSEFLHYQFFGHLSSTRLARFWQLCHIGIFPSIHPEAFGIVSAEIMASGVCLISSGVGGSKELFQHNQTGFLFEAGSSLSLSNTICSLINSPDILLRTAAKGKHHVIDNFDVSISADKLVSLFSSTIN